MSPQRDERGRDEEGDYRGDGRQKERSGGRLLGDTGQSGPGRVAGKVRERVERGLGDTEGGGKRGNGKKEASGDAGGGGEGEVVVLEEV